MKYKNIIRSLIILFYVFFVGQCVRACEDQVGPSGQSDCPDNKDHCTDPVWREFMEEQCPVTCGVCTLTARVENGIYDDPKLIASINQDLDPCDDFYKYVCDGFLKNNAMLISRDRPRIDQMTYWYRELSDRQFAILENNRLTSENEEDDYIQQMYLFYDTCRDEAGRRRENSQAVLNKIAVLKSSPNTLLAFNTDFLIKTSTISSRAELETPDALGINQPIPAMPFYSYSTFTDLRNTSRGIFYFGPAMFSMLAGGPPFFSDPMFDKARENFKNYLRSIVKLLIEDESATGSHRMFAQPVGGNWSTEIERRVESFMTVETARAKIFSSPEGQPENQEEMEKQRREMEEDPYKIMSYVSVAQIKQYLTSFDLAQFWAAIIPMDILSSRGLSSIDQMEIMMTVPLENLKEYDGMVLSLPPQAVSDYLEWFILLNHVSILDDRYRALAIDFAGQNISARFDCKTQTLKYFPHQGDRLYAEAFFPEDVRTSVMDMFDYIDEAFGDMLEELDWMDDDTRDEALDKLDAIDIHIGYVEEIFDNERIEEIYEGYDLRAGMSFVEVIAMLDEWRARYELEKLAETPPFYNSASQVISAYYMPDRNLFNAMMTYLEGLHYTKNRPTVMNFGAIGAVLAHEVTHGFDHTGSKHDADGNIRDWWDPETKQSFNEKKQCIIDQYSNYILKLNETYSQHLDGVLMQGENIADNGGVRAAFKAWQYFADDVEDGLAEDPSETYSIGTIEDFTDEQLFFISAGFMDCNVVSSEYEYNMLNNIRDTHAPGEARVNQVFRNQPEFARAFRCPRGSGMNPVQKCSVW